MKPCKSRPVTGVILFLSLFLLGFWDARVLPPAAAGNFSRVVAKINTSGRLGPTIRATGVAIGQSDVKLSLKLNEHDEPVTVLLTSASSLDMHVHSRWFSLSTDSDKLTGAHLQSLAALLDEVFPSDPFIDPSNTPRDEPSFEHYKQELIRQASMETGVLGRGHVVAIALLLIAATGITTWHVLGSSCANTGARRG